MQAQAATDLADGGLEELEVLGVAEPAREHTGDRLGTDPLPQARRQQGAQVGTSGERAAELREVLSGEAFQERPGEGEARNYAGRPVTAGCHHGTVVRVRAVIVL